MRIDHDNVSLLVFHLPSKRSFHFPPLSSRSSPALLHAVGPDSALKLLYGLGSLLPAVPKAVHGLAVSAGDGVQVSKWSLYPRVQADTEISDLLPFSFFPLPLPFSLSTFAAGLSTHLLSTRKKDLVALSKTSLEASGKSFSGPVWVCLVSRASQ